MSFRMFSVIILAVVTANTASGQRRQMQHPRPERRHPADPSVVPVPGVALPPTPILSPAPTLSPSPMLSMVPTVLPTINGSRRDDDFGSSNKPDHRDHRRPPGVHRKLSVYTIVEPSSAIPPYTTSGDVIVPGGEHQSSPYTIPTYQVPTYSIPSYH